MTKLSSTARPKLLARVVTLAAALLVSASAFAATGGALQQSGTDLGDRGSLQRGAKLYMNYCSGCHSLQYLRYSRIAEDLGLTEEQVQENLNFTGVAVGEQVHAAMPEQASEWFGVAPPDLSVIARVRGSDWIYTYLKSFYLDESRPVGWNNQLFPNAAMPNPLWQLQGLQHAEYGELDPALGERPVTALKITRPGQQDPEAFSQTVRDITAFLEYAGEPAALKRQSMGVWVVLFLAMFTFIAWLLKKEYWRDVK